MFTSFALFASKDTILISTTINHLSFRKENRGNIQNVILIIILTHTAYFELDLAADYGQAAGLKEDRRVEPDGSDGGEEDCQGTSVVLTAWDGLKGVRGSEE